MDIDALYCDTEEWTKKSIFNVARIGKFSSDRTILEYNHDIWHAEPVPIERNQIEPQQSGTGNAKAEVASPRQTRK
jgi:starch phosphorylase